MAGNATSRISFAMLLGIGAAILPIPGTYNVLITSAETPPTSGEACPQVPQEYDSGGPPRAAFPNDPFFDRQWGLDQIKAPEAWARGATGKGALIGLVDTGVDLGHPDLRANLVPGVNLLETLDGCPRPQDTNGHGTLVAGVAVGVANNRVGLAGVAFDAKLMPIRAVSNDAEFGLSQGPIAEGIRYAADRGAGVITLMAVTFPFPTDSPTTSQDDAIPAAVAYAWEKGAVVIAPAVNGGLPACGYPAVVELVVCVAATDHEGVPAKYSNLPVKPDLLGLRAPGGFGANRGVIPPAPPLLPMCEDDRDVWTTFLPRRSDCGVRGYGTDAGTTEASAYVAGVAAMLSGMGLSNAEIVECLKTTSFNPLTSDTRGTYDPVYGWGIVDADRATSSCV